MSKQMNVPGYEALHSVLLRAYNQAALTKGAERHANSLPFHEQPMQTIAGAHGVGFLFGQAAKKAQEAHNMHNRGETAKAIHEVLGAINYLAGAIIYMELAEQKALWGMEPKGTQAKEDRVGQEAGVVNEVQASESKDDPRLAQGLQQPCDCPVCTGEISLPAEIEQAVKQFEAALAAQGIIAIRL